MTNSTGNRPLLLRVAQCRQDLARGSILFLSAVVLWAQSPVNLGTPDPTVVVALGQVTTLTFVGAPTKLPIANGPAVEQASEVPLPTMLAGFSAAVSQLPSGY